MWWPWKKSKKEAEKSSQKSYEAAQSSRFWSKWILGGITDANSELKIGLVPLRNRARDLERNNEYISSFLRELENNVVGPRGFRLQMNVNKTVSGELKPDSKVNNAIEYHWKQFCKAKNYTVRGRQSATAADRMIIRSIARDGEVLVRLIPNYENSDYKFSIQILESDHIDESYDDDLSNGNRIRMGVEVDKWRRCVAIHVFKTHPGASGRTGTRVRTRIPASEIIHAYIEFRADQDRGVSWFAPIAVKTKQLAGYDEAEIVAARAGAAKMAFLKTTGGDVPASYKGEPVNGEDSREGHWMDASPGSIEILPEGMDIETWDPQHPTSQFEAFRKGILRAIASGLGISYNKLANDLEKVNYSSLREGKLTERDFWLFLQDWFIEHIKIPIFSQWLEVGLLAGKITDPVTGKPLSAVEYDNYNCPEFTGRRWAWVDPVKDLQALKIARDENWISDRDAISTQGGDIENVYSTIKSDNELASSYGVGKES